MEESFSCMFAERLGGRWKNEKSWLVGPELARVDLLMWIELVFTFYGA